MNPTQTGAPRRTSGRPFNHYTERASIVALHLGALWALLRGASPLVMSLAAVAYVVRMFGVTAGHHRYFSHRAFKTSRAFQAVLAFLGTASGQKGPLWWASLHRRHHRSADTADDVHSPTQRGFWHAHWMWWWGAEFEETDYELVKDWTKYPELLFLDRHYQIGVLLDLAICYAVLGLDGLLWVSVLPTVLIINGESAINSVCHLWGARRFDTRDTSRNNALVAIWTLGEGWHNNHHQHMGSANHGFRWWEVDVTYYLIRLLQLLGLVWDVRVAPPLPSKRRAVVSAVTPGE
jgi:stearoyl-CoA desaturase (delta-9 desaturase)